MEKKIYRVTDVNYDRRTEYLSWVYGGREYWAQGEFYIDSRGYLHHSFFTPRGVEREFKIKVY